MQIKVKMKENYIELNWIELYPVHIIEFVLSLF